MEITFRIEILILIAIVLTILWGHVICSCSRFSIFELFGEVIKKVSPNQHQYDLVMTNPALEGFTGASINNGQSASYNVSYNKPIDTSSWFSQNLTFTPGEKPKKGAQDILNREPQPVPLPEGELLLFANTPFKPECCANGGSSYSNSTGCACITLPQYNYLIERGSNNVPYSSY